MWAAPGTGRGSCNVGIDELNNFGAIELSFYPNPSNEVVTIQYDLSSIHFTKAELVIKNSVGQSMDKITLSGISNSIDLKQTLSDGVYLMTLLIDGKAAKTLRHVVVH